MKISSKKDLKKIIKECLVEILAEGLGNVAYESSDVDRPMTPVDFATSRKKVTESVAQHSHTSTPEPVKAAVRELSAQNPSLASIFEDTARTTLLQQSQVGRRAGMVDDVEMPILQGDYAQRVAATATPDQLFGDESASKWADLAFAGVTKKI
jgi:hypothetical protein